MATSLEEADIMVRAARKAVILMIAENVGFHLFNLKFKEIMNQGLISNVFLVRISGGIHDVDALRMLIGGRKKFLSFKLENFS